VRCFEWYKRISGSSVNCFCGDSVIGVSIMSFQVISGSNWAVFAIDADEEDYEAVIRCMLDVGQLFPILVKPVNQPDALWRTARWFSFQGGQTYVLRSFEKLSSGDARVLPHVVPTSYYTDVFKDFNDYHMDVVGLIASYSVPDPILPHIHLCQIADALNDIHSLGDVFQKCKSQRICSLSLEVCKKIEGFAEELFDEMRLVNNWEFSSALEAEIKSQMSSAERNGVMVVAFQPLDQRLRDAGCAVIWIDFERDEWDEIYVEWRENAVRFGLITIEDRFLCFLQNENGISIISPEIEIQPPSFSRAMELDLTPGPYSGTAKSSIKEMERHTFAMLRELHLCMLYLGNHFQNDLSDD
jgi:hypothetical protein